MKRLRCYNFSGDMMIEKEEYIQFKELKNHNDIIHLFTKKPYNFSKITSTEENIKKEYEKIEKEVNFNFLSIKKPIQTHTNIVKVLTKENLNDDFQDVDGLITDLKGVALVTSLADCQGILLYDPIKKIIGNIHSGWKGTLNKIIVNAIKLMEENFGCDPKNIEAYICPSILKCCFEVDKEVVDMFYENYNNIDDYVMKGDIKQGKQKYYIDTISINVNSMKELGLLEENIHCSNICTKCHSDKYHSYRTDHDKSGRNIALICLK